MTNFFKKITELYSSEEEAKEKISSFASFCEVEPDSLSLIMICGYDAGAGSYDLYKKNNDNWEIIFEDEFGKNYPCLPIKYAVALPL